jgi:hypothetical protein
MTIIEIIGVDDHKAKALREKIFDVLSGQLSSDDYRIVSYPGSRSIDFHCNCKSFIRLSSTDGGTMMFISGCLASVGVEIVMQPSITISPR